MTKLIRFDEDHFGYLVEFAIEPPEAAEMRDRFVEAWPGKTLLIVEADEFIDLTGQYEIVPVKDAVPA